MSDPKFKGYVAAKYCMLGGYAIYKDDKLIGAMQSKQLQIKVIKLLSKNKYKTWNNYSSESELE
jgi:TfoX/Sxy family transcriptional regulator of competence genes